MCDLAERLELFISTVSRALNNRSVISPETRERVRKAMVFAITSRED